MMRRVKKGNNLIIYIQYIFLYMQYNMVEKWVVLCMQKGNSFLILWNSEPWKAWHFWKQKVCMKEYLSLQQWQTSTDSKEQAAYLSCNFCQEVTGYCIRFEPPSQNCLSGTLSLQSHMKKSRNRLLALLQWIFTAFTFLVRAASKFLRTEQKLTRDVEFA